MSFQLTGKVEDCCCDVEAVNSLNKEVYPRILEIVKQSYFKFYKVFMFDHMIHIKMVTIPYGDGFGTVTLTQNCLSGPCIIKTCMFFF